MPLLPSKMCDGIDKHRNEIRADYSCHICLAKLPPDKEVAYLVWEGDESHKVYNTVQVFLDDRKKIDQKKP